MLTLVVCNVITALKFVPLAMLLPCTLNENISFNKLIQSFICVLVLNPEIEKQIMESMFKTERGWECGQQNCDYVSKNIGNVRRHVESKHLDIVVQCPYCHKFCPTKHALTMHIKRNHQ